MKRLDENLREYSKGKYVLFTDYEEEVARLKEELKNLKKEFKIATTVDAWKYYFAEKEKTYQGSDW
jgi:hypothetical protein